MAGVEDEILVRRVAAGDERALGGLYDRYAGLVYGAGTRYLGDRGQAEDLVQDVFLSVWRNAGRFDPSRASFSTWVYRITRNRATDLVRRRKARVRTVDADLPPEPREPDPSGSLSRGFDVAAAPRAALPTTTARCSSSRTSRGSRRGRSPRAPARRSARSRAAPPPRCAPCARRCRRGRRGGEPVSEHPETRDLLGPFVMGDLDPAEERAVEEHLEDCVSCSEEAESLRLAHEPHARVRRRLGGSSPAPEGPGRRRPAGPLRAAHRARVGRRRGGRAARGAGLAFGPSLLGSQEVAAATLEPMGEAPDAGAEVNVRGAGENLEVSVDAWGLPKCEREEYYELWFVEENGEHVSAGSFTVDESGDAELDLTAPQFATSYQRIGVTVERDKDPRPSGVMMMGGELRGS